MKKDVPPYPLDICFFGSNTIMPGSNGITHLIKEPRFFVGINILNSVKHHSLLAHSILGYYL